MIGFSVLGRLGNHLFQYAFIYSAGKKLKSSFFIRYGKANVTSPKLPHYFRLGNYSPLRNYILNLLSSGMRRVEIDAFAPPEKELDKIKDDVLYNGFAQSEKYFLNAKTDVHDIFSIKKKFIRRFNEKYGALFQTNKVLVVHVRRGDYAHSGADFLGSLDIQLPLSYYSNSFHQLKNINDYKIIFISDDIDYCKQHFGTLNNCIFESNPEIIDFQLLMNADAAIISNSSFAWWGAYLNKKKNKIIIAPRYWMGFKVKKEFPAGITSVHGWNWIEA